MNNTPIQSREHEFAAEVQSILRIKAGNRAQPTVYLKAAITQHQTRDR